MLITKPGRYRTRNGREVMLRSNVEGWLDKLPWVVVREVVNYAGTMIPKDTYEYTVNDEGLVWPEELEYRHGQVIEPRLFPCPVWTRDDIVSIVEEST